MMALPESSETLAALPGKQVKGAALHAEGEAGWRTLDRHIFSCGLKTGALHSEDSVGQEPTASRGLSLSSSSDGRARDVPTMAELSFPKLQEGDKHPLITSVAHLPPPPNFYPSGFFPGIIPHPIDPGCPAESPALRGDLVSCRRTPELCGDGIGQGRGEILWGLHRASPGVQACGLYPSRARTLPFIAAVPVGEREGGWVLRQPLSPPARC